MPPPVPPRVNAGRMMSGNVPISATIRSRSARERATPDRGTSSPMRNIASLNNCRSSPFAMACAFAPINFTPCRASEGKRNHVNVTRESLRHLRHALPIQPHFANAFDAGEDVVHGLTAETHQFRADDTGDEIARKIENLLRR